MGAPLLNLLCGHFSRSSHCKISHAQAKCSMQSNDNKATDATQTPPTPCTWPASEGISRSGLLAKDPWAAYPQQAVCANPEEGIPKNGGGCPEQIHSARRTRVSLFIICAPLIEHKTTATRVDPKATQGARRAQNAINNNAQLAPTVTLLFWLRWFKLELAAHMQWFIFPLRKPVVR